MTDGDDAIRREFRAFARYLVGSDPGGHALAHYARWHAARGGAEVAGAPAIDRVLVAVARVHPFAARIADAYCARFRRAALLRRKLVLVLALVECSPATYALVEEPRSPGPAAAWTRIALSAAAEALALVLGAIVLLPVHAILCLAPGGARRAA